MPQKREDLGNGVFFDKNIFEVVDNLGGPHRGAVGTEQAGSSRLGVRAAVEGQVHRQVGSQLEERDLQDAGGTRVPVAKVKRRRARVHGYRERTKKT